MLNLYKTIPRFNYISTVAVFNSKKYDITYFQQINAKLPTENQVDFHFYEEPLNEKTAKLADECDTACCFVNDKVTAKTLKGLQSYGVDLIALRCAGYNNVDIRTAQKLNIKVVRVPSYSPEAVAEHAMALLLAVNRKIHKAYNRTRDNNFALDGLLGTTLFGKTVGLIGTGTIGKCFIRICKGFGMKVICYDIKEDKDLVNNLGVEFVSENDIFRRSDVISLHCPLTPQTRHILNNEAFELMKHNVIIVNTGRGALIDSKAAIKSLKQGSIGGLALDVYEQEERLFFKDVSSEIMEDDVLARLLSFNNVIVTGHQAFFTEEGISNICETTLNNIIDIRQKGECQNQIIMK